MVFAATGTIVTELRRLLRSISFEARSRDFFQKVLRGLGVSPFWYALASSRAALAGEARAPWKFYGFHMVPYDFMISNDALDFIWIHMIL